MFRPSLVCLVADARLKTLLRFDGCGDLFFAQRAIFLTAWPDSDVAFDARALLSCDLPPLLLSTFWSSFFSVGFDLVDSAEILLLVYVKRCDTNHSQDGDGSLDFALPRYYSRRQVSVFT